MQVVSDTKPYRWINGHIGRKEPIPNDLVTQQQYLDETPAKPWITTSTVFPGRDTLNFSGNAVTGIKDPAMWPVSMRSFSVFLQFEVKTGWSGGSYDILRQFAGENATEQTGFAVRYLTDRFLLQSAVNAGGSSGFMKVTNPVVGDLLTLAGTFDNASRALKSYDGNMSAPVHSTTAAAGSLVPNSHQLIIGALVGGAPAAPVAYSNIILWPRALTSAELVAVKGAIDTIEGT
jgi:hypothetical protein